MFDRAIYHSRQAKVLNTTTIVIFSTNARASLQLFECHPLPSRWPHLSANCARKTQTCPPPWIWIKRHVPSSSSVFLYRVPAGRINASSALHLGAKHAMRFLLSTLGYSGSGVPAEGDVGIRARTVGPSSLTAARAVGATSFITA